MGEAGSFWSNSQMDHQDNRSHSMGKAGLQPMVRANGGCQGKSANSATNARTDIVAQPAQRQSRTTPPPAPYHQGSGGSANPNKMIRSASDREQVPHIAQRSFILYHPYFHCLQLFFRQVYGADIIYDLAASAFSTHTEQFGPQKADEALG